ncbi:hypothetical protein C0W35_09400 [Photobacterium kishitanii]|uniref:flagellin N-terminal helical domain-containing protein n=1 Tax=Photobacterium kishitanii TaxID=318456 RepID=UPI000D152869|nr:flagellin [Photobacterium kishitanii]PSU85082.1 hypothetical protein C0W42_21565 [Photobacterium kishitanii]PSU94257.1 hypothetical protein C0W35_09400 [Photobacterium kishitanii]
MLSINYNSASRNAVNQVGNAQTGIAKAMNALSTGNRINSAADDVAGSAMASRMQVQSNSLDTAVTNANMGVNLIQTMDGAMKETEELLQRMTKLTEMSKNDAYSTQDRDMMDQEFGALSNELDRNAQSANYNGISLINNAGNTAGSSLFDKDISKGITFTAGDATAKPPVPANNTLTFKVTTAPMIAAVPAVKGGAAAVPAKVGTPVDTDITVDFGTNALSANDIVGAINKALKAAGANANATINSEGHLKIDSNDRVDGVKFGASKITNIGGTAAAATGLGAGTATDGKTGFGDIVINVGSSGNAYDNIFLKTVDLSSEGLGLKGASLTNSTDLDKTLSTLKAALDTVTEQRSHLGASQKRLTFASDNLQNVKNNTDASLSSIEDTDYAATTMQLAKEKVLNSASQAMLGQSNQMQSEVTQLLK